MTIQTETPSANVAAFAAMGAAVAPNAIPGVYNLSPANLLKWRKARSGVISGARRAKVACVGDSNTTGYGSVAGGAANCVASSYPRRLADRLAAGGVAARWDSAWGTFNESAVNIPIYDTRRVVGAGWAPGDGGAWSLGGPALLNNTTTNAYSVTPTGQFDTVDVWVLRNTGLGTVAVDVDGGVATNIALIGGSDIYKTTISAGALGTHTVNIRRVSGDCYVVGVDCYNSAAPEAAVYNIGWDSGTSGNMATATKGYSPLPALGLIQPDVTILMNGINDWNASIAVSTYTTNNQAIITKGKLTGDVIVMAPIETTGAAAAAAQAPYRTAMRDLAAANGCVFIDMQERFGTYATANANGFMADSSHPMGVAYTDMACLVSRVLLAA